MQDRGRLRVERLSPSASSGPRHFAERTLREVANARGRRLRGTVSEEDPKTGVKMVLVDGSTRTVPAAEVARVEHGALVASGLVQGAGLTMTVLGSVELAPWVAPQAAGLVGRF